MSEEQYKKLNNYFSILMPELEKKDSFLIENIKDIDVFSCAYRRLFDDYNGGEKTESKTYLSFEEVYLLAREVIENINPNYLEPYDRLIESGELDFSYESIYDNSRFSFHWNSQGEIGLIDINRSFDYDEVRCLVHEFIHYTNGYTKNHTNNHYLLTEFLSIYFEFYTLDYLIENKKIDKKELDDDKRLLSSRRSACDIAWFSLSLLAYDRFGSINKETVSLLNKYYLNLSEEICSDEQKRVLDLFEKVEKEYRFEILYKEEFNVQKLSKRLANYMNHSYRYLLGTILACYAMEHCKMEDILYLNNHINDKEIGIVQILASIGIDIKSSSFLKDSMESVKRRLEKNNEKIR